MKNLLTIVTIAIIAGFLAMGTVSSKQTVSGSNVLPLAVSGRVVWDTCDSSGLVNPVIGTEYKSDPIAMQSGNIGECQCNVMAKGIADDTVKVKFYFANTKTGTQYPMYVSSSAGGVGSVYEYQVVLADTNYAKFGFHIWGLKGNNWLWTSIEFSDTTDYGSMDIHCNY